MTVRFELLHADAGTRARRGRLRTPHGTVETPGLHAGGHRRHGEGGGTGRSPEPRRADPPRQHLPPDAPARRGAGRRARRPAPVHGLGPAHAHRLGRVPGLQPRRRSGRSPRRARRFQSHLDGSRHLSTPERSIADPGDARRRRHHGLRRVPAVQVRPPVHGGVASPAPPAGCTGARRPGAASARRSSASSRAGSTSRTCGAVTPRRSARSICPATRSAATRSASAPRRCTPRSRTRPPLLPRGQATLPHGRGHSAGPGRRCVGAGVDMFDCVLPTRCARNGLLFTHAGQARSSGTPPMPATSEPLDPDCGCYTCRTLHRAYLRHLFAAEELLAMRLTRCTTSTTTSR